MAETQSRSSLESLVDAPVALRGALDVPTYRALMAFPTWDFVGRAILATRAYARGLDAGLALVRFTEVHRDVLDAREVDTNRISLHYFLLEMLDRLDHWEAYLATWQTLRTQTRWTVTRDAVLLDQVGYRIRPFLVAQTEDVIRVHFLWPTIGRKAVIERKLARQRRGAKVGNLRHRPPDELSEDERRRRLDGLLEAARALGLQPVSSATIGPTSVSNWWVCVPPIARPGADQDDS